MVTFDQLVRTANQRLFKLKDKVQRYGPEAENPLLKQAMAQASLFGSGAPGSMNPAPSTKPD
jgi:hypothetical protein